MTHNLALSVLNEEVITPEEEDAIQSLYRHRDLTKDALSKIIKMARKHADGTNDASIFNENYDILKSIYGEFEKERFDEELVNKNSFPYASNNNY